MEQLLLLWLRPDGEEAVKVVFTYETPEEASEAVAECLDVLEVIREALN